MPDITFTSERSKATYNIKSAVAKHSQIKEYLLILHAWTGCDTTSAINGKGKTSLLKKVEASAHLLQLLDVLKDQNEDQSEVGESGVQLFLYLYGGKDALAKLRYNKFMDMAAKGDILPENLPPTESAAVQHSLRVHQQAILWQTFNSVSIHPLQWGWKEENSKYVPQTSSDDVAPPELLKFIRCNCKLLNNMCTSTLCTCKRYAMKCVSACGTCRGEVCEKTEEVHAEPDIDEIDRDGNIFDILDGI